MSEQQVLGPSDFAAQLLAGIGAPVTPGNVTTVTNWERAEGGNWHNSATFNPLNTTLHAPGSHTVYGNSPAAHAGVQAFPDWVTGLKATIDTLLEKRYTAVVADLRANAPERVVAADVAASPWGTGNWAAGKKSSPPTVTAGLVGIHVPGLPFDVPNPLEVPGKIAGGATDVVGKGLGEIIDLVRKPLEAFIENGALILLGIIAVIVGLVVLAHQVGDGDDEEKDAAAGAVGAKKGGGEPAGGEAGGGAGEAAAAL